MADAASHYIRKGDRMKICFVGQENYFKKEVEHDLDGLYEVVWKNITFGNVGDWRDLLDIEADLFVFFMPHTVPPHILQQLRGKYVGKHAEPMPKYCQGRMWYTVDTIQRFNDFVPCAKHFKHLYHHDKSSLPILEREGIVAKEFPCPIAIGTYYPEDLPKTWDVIFTGKDNPYRWQVMSQAKHRMCGKFLHICHGVVGNDLRIMLNRAKIGLNVHVEPIPAMEYRLQEMMACRLFVLSQPLSHNDLFKPGVHFVEFTTPDDLWEKINHYLEHEDEREAIAQAGYELVTTKLAAKVAWPRLINEVMGEQANA